MKNFRTTASIARNDTSATRYIQITAEFSFVATVGTPRDIPKLQPIQ
jgi:hypothetical protein